MTYSESAKGLRIDYRRAMIELDRHAVCPEDRGAFATEVKPGRDGLYSASAVLAWLGY